jgi:hypothetical protein
MKLKTRGWLAVLALPLVWAPPAFVNHQPPYDGAAGPANPLVLGAVSCPSTSLCVAADTSGDLMTSTAPLSGAGSWRITRADSQVRPSFFVPSAGAISCPSEGFCAAVDTAGNLLTSTHPTSPDPRWVRTKLETVGTPGPLPAPEGLSAISCPRVNFCAAADASGNVLISGSPAAGAASWTTERVDPQPGIFGLSGISCPSSSLCVAVNSRGDVLTSTNPRRTASWHGGNIDASAALSNVACPTTSLCLADDGRNVLFSRNPAAGPGSWQRIALKSAGDINGLTRISCASISWCAVPDRAGNVFTSNNPTGGAAAWSQAQVVTGQFAAIPGGGIEAISCPSQSFCLAVDSLGHAAWSTQPSGGAGTWTVQQVAGGNAAADVTCPGTWCAAIDQSGGILISTRPDRGAWSIVAPGVPTPSPGAATGAISCPSASLCAAVHGTPDVLASVNPQQPGTWRSTAIDPGNSLTGIACPTLSLCVAVDSAGNALTGTPAGWATHHIDPDLTPWGQAASLQSISCPSASLCVAADSAGNLLVTRDPASAPPSWDISDVNRTNPISSVSCPTPRLCSAAGASTLLTSTDPAGGVGSWTATTLPSAVTRVTCSPSRFCLALIQGGGAASFTAAAGGASAWQPTSPEASPLWAAACSVTAWCVVMDGTGSVAYARPARPSELLLAPLRGAASSHPMRRRLGRLLRSGYSLSFASPLPGRLDVSWVATPGRTLIARGTMRFPASGTRTLHLTLTAAGRRRLAHALKVRSVARFTLTGGHSLVGTARFGL